MCAIKSTKRSVLTEKSNDKWQINRKHIEWIIQCCKRNSRWLKIQIKSQPALAQKGSLCSQSSLSSQNRQSQLGLTHGSYAVEVFYFNSIITSKARLLIWLWLTCLPLSLSVTFFHVTVISFYSFAWGWATPTAFASSRLENWIYYDLLHFN